MVKARTKKKQRKTAEQIDQEQAYEDYSTERDLLSKIEQTNYDNYEKTILTLAAAFLAFSVSFLGLFRNKTTSGAPLPQLVSPNLLISSWICFAASILFLLICFLINGVALRAEVIELESRLEGEPPSEKLNPWSVGGYVLYALAGLSFISGLVVLLAFCAKNIHLF